MEALKILYVGLGGFIGASLRYILSTFTSSHFTNIIPIGTLLVNVTGGFLIGAIYTFTTYSSVISPNTKLFLTTGLLGGLTTFSTFSYETINLIEQTDYSLAIVNILLNVILSLLGVLLGKWTITQLFC